MSTPTQITEAHRITVRAMRSVGDETWALSYEKAAQFIADSEARAVAEVVNALTCTHHNDQMRVACPVCLVTALATERDQLRAELAAERARLDWLEERGPWESWFQPAREVSLLLRAPIRAAIDAAMQETAK